MAEKKTIVVPNEERCKPAELPFGVVTGVGVPDYDNVKSKGKRGGTEFSIAIQLDKKQAKDLKKEIMEYWDEHKTKKMDDVPANFDNIVREGKDDYKGTWVVYAKTQIQFENEKGDVTPNVVQIVGVDASGTVQKLDPEEFGYIGKGSEGRVAAILSIYGDDEDAGVSVFLSAVKLTKFVKLEASGGASAFGDSDSGEIDGAGGFKSEKKKDKKKAKHVEPDDDDDDDDDDEVEVPKKKKKKKGKKEKK